MKFDFWFDLPQALVSVMESNLSKEDIEYSSVLFNSYQSFNKTFNTVNNVLSTNMNSLSSGDLEVIQNKMNSIKIETAELLCKAIKFSTKLMSRLLGILENYNSCKITEVDLLTKIKLFLKITRLVIENSKSQAQNTQGREQEFFTM